VHKNRAEGQNTLKIDLKTRKNDTKTRKKHAFSREIGHEKAIF